VARCCSFVANRTRLLNPGEQNIEKGRLAELNTCWADPSALQCLRKARPRESIEAEIKSQETMFNMDFGDRGEMAFRVVIANRD
jgi:hypothetical protein